MYEFAVKKGGLSFTRILINQTHALKNGFTKVPVDQRLIIKFRVKEFENGKIKNRKLINTVSEGFTPFKLN